MQETTSTLQNGKNSLSKIVIDITKCNKREFIFKRTKKQDKVDPLKGLEIQNHPSIF